LSSRGNRNFSSLSLFLFVQDLKTESAYLRHVHAFLNSRRAPTINGIYPPVWLFYFIRHSFFNMRLKHTFKMLQIPRAIFCLSRAFFIFCMNVSILITLHLQTNSLCFKSSLVCTKQAIAPFRYNAMYIVQL